MEATGVRRRREALVGAAVLAAAILTIPSAPAASAGAGSAAPPRVAVTLQSGRLVIPLPIVSSCPAGGGACQQTLISPGYPTMTLRAGGTVQLQLGAPARSLSLELAGATVALGAGQGTSWRVPQQGGDGVVTAVYPEGTVSYLLRFAAEAGPAPAPSGGAPSAAPAPGPAGPPSSAGSGASGPPVATVCAPAAIHLETSRASVAAPAVGPVCHDLGAPLAILTPSELARAAAGARLTVRPGTPLRLRFDAPARGTVRLELRRGSDLKLIRVERLSPVATTWLARGGGVLVVVARFHTPVAIGAPALVEARYAARLVLR